uniref:C2H2-type domain-containing protein n=1 Tax=Steinernema glaseri TaxID=37863 RepID=A0A1I7Y3J6_9BILA
MCGTANMLYPVDRRFFCPAPACQEKNRWFPTPKKLNQHYLKVHTMKKFECGTCSRTFSLDRDLKYHIKTQHKSENIPRRSHANRVKVWTCVTCGEDFDRQYELNDHIRVEHENYDKRYECAQCELSFETVEEVISHVAEMHPEITLETADHSTNQPREMDSGVIEEEGEAGMEVQRILQKFHPIKPKLSVEPPNTDDLQGHHVENTVSREEMQEMRCDYETHMEMWPEESFASTQTEYYSTELTSSYSQTDTYFLCDPSDPVQYRYEYDPFYMDRQDFGAQTYYAETQDFGAQIGDTGMSASATWCPMEMTYDGVTNYSLSADTSAQSMCHVGTTSCYSDWTRHTETQTDQYYYPYQQTSHHEPMIRFSHESTQTNEVTYSNQMV